MFSFRLMFPDVLLFRCYIYCIIFLQCAIRYYCLEHFFAFIFFHLHIVDVLHFTRKMLPHYGAYHVPHWQNSIRSLEKKILFNSFVLFYLNRKNWFFCWFVRFAYKSFSFSHYSLFSVQYQVYHTCVNVFSNVALGWALNI